MVTRSKDKLMSRYLVSQETANKALEVTTRYWAGGVLESGAPRTTKNISDARKFETARDAYDAAGEIEGLDWWQVSQRLL